MIVDIKNYRVDDKTDSLKDYLMFLNFIGYNYQINQENTIYCTGKNKKNQVAIDLKTKDIRVLNLYGYTINQFNMYTIPNYSFGLIDN